jgi:hypothetical protein
MHWTEQAIKSCLDGTFTKLMFGEAGARSVTGDVSTSFVPNYSHLIGEKRAGKRRALGRAHRWTPAEDEKLRTLRGAGGTLYHCSAHIGRSPEACRDRAERLGLRKAVSA